MSEKSKKIITWSAIAIFILVVLATFFIPKKSQAPQSNLDSLAQCLSDKGAKFYGAFWCSHCQAQKKLFGSAQNKLPYVECSTPDGKGQMKICEDAKIDGYPTWVFADGSRVSGEITIEVLSKKTGCALPQ